MFLNFAFSNLINIFIAIVCIFHIAIVIIFFRNWRNGTHRWFSFLVMSLIGWCATMMVYRYYSAKEGMILWAILLYESAIFIPFTFLHFVLIFPEGYSYKINWVRKILIVIPVLIIVVLTAIPYAVIKDIVFPIQGEKILIWGKYYLWYTIYISLYFTSAFIVLFKKYLKISGIEKVQIRFVILGALPSTLFGCLTNLILPTFGIFTFNWLGQITTLIFAIFIVYAILKHHLLNIKIIATELFVGVLILLVLFNVFVPIIFQHQITRLILFVMVLVFSILLIRGVLKMERMNEHLRKLLEIKSEFLDIVSHQLRTPVSVINGVVSMLQEGDINLNNRKEYEEFVKSIYAKGRKLTQITEDILSASQVDAEEFKIDDNSKKATQMEEVIESVIGVLKEEADKKGLVLAFEKPKTKLPAIAVSSFYLEQAISNLVSNAIIYTPKGFVKISAREENNQMIIAVSDSGIGIPKEDIPKLFDKFVRASNANNVYTDGSGLGLFIVKKLIEAHNGSVSVKSEEGKGSVFTISLPVE